MINNKFVGTKFKAQGEEYVVTWNDCVHVRVTPIKCSTGLTSHDMTVAELKNYIDEDQ